MARFLLCSSPIGGHVLPVRTIGRALLARGHGVRMLTGSRFRDAVERDGMRFLPWPAAADYDDRDLSGAFPGRDQVSGAAAAVFDIQHVFADPIAHQHAAITAALAAEPADAILADASVGGLIPLLVAADRRTPVHLISCTPLPITSRDTYPYGLGLEPPRTARARADAERLTRTINEEALAGVQATADAALAAVGLGPLPVYYVNWRTLADRYWALTVPGFEYPRTDQAECIRFAGPLAIGSQAGLPAWWDELDGSRPVVHVTQGTVANDDFGMLIGPTMRALADDDVTVVVATGGKPVDVLPRPLPANVRAAAMLPYDQLLPKVDVLVTNGGYGGVQLAIAHSVPVIVAGEKEDKPDIAARVSWAGNGINLRTGCPEPAAIAHAVHAVLTEPGYRTAARLLGKQAAAHDAIGAIVAGLETAHRA